MSVNSGCRKFVEIKPADGILTPSVVFSNDNNATAALTAVYSYMTSLTNNFASGDQSISLLAGLSADELSNYSTNPYQQQFFANAIASDNSYNKNTWTQLYKCIYETNSVLEGLSRSSSVTPPVRKQLTGEALFLRAFFYFYLVNLYGPVPLALTTDYQTNNGLPRSPTATVYTQIISDLLESGNMLPEDYRVSSEERIRPNKYAANALLARTYLFCHNWLEASNYASLVIKETSLYRLSLDLHPFLKNSPESILQLIPSVPGYNTLDANTFIITGPPSSISLSPYLVNIFSTEDKRWINWVGHIDTNGKTYYYPLKYKARRAPDITEYLMLLRLAEQYLIRAEALAKMNYTDSATADLNLIRSRAGLANITGMSQPQVLAAIDTERKRELFTEWGCRWLDLKRNGAANQVLAGIKGNNWNANDTLFPIPQSEIQFNPRLTQNPGY